jgi:hypothetical protein
MNFLPLYTTVIDVSKHSKLKLDLVRYNTSGEIFLNLTKSVDVKKSITDVSLNIEEIQTLPQVLSSTVDIYKKLGTANRRCIINYRAGGLLITVNYINSPIERIYLLPHEVDLLLKRLDVIQEHVNLNQNQDSYSEEMDHT